MKGTKPFLKWGHQLLVGLLLMLVVVLAVLRFTVVSYWTIPQNGMYPSLAAGTKFFGINNPYKVVGDVKRGDIVVFERYTGADRYIYIWRVVGLPGDSVAIDDTCVTLNGKALSMEKVRSEGDLDIFRETSGEASYEVAYDRTGPQGPSEKFTMTVPEDHLFVLGDNRPHASDSRFMGPIPFSSVIAKKW